MNAGRLQLALIAGAVVLAGAGVFALTRRGAASAAGASVGTAAVQAVDGFIGSAVQEAAAVFGVPKTNVDKCAQAKAAGDAWAVSLYCAAADFLGYVFTPKPSAPIDAYTDTAEGWTVFDQEDADIGLALRGQAFAETTGGAVTGLVRRR